MKTNLTIAAGLGNKVKAKAKTILAGGSQEDMKQKMTLAARLRNEVLVVCCRDRLCGRTSLPGTALLANGSQDYVLDSVSKQTEALSACTRN